VQYEKIVYWIEDPPDEQGSAIPNQPLFSLNYNEQLPITKHSLISSVHKLLL